MYSTIMYRCENPKQPDLFFLYTDQFHVNSTFQRVVWPARTALRVSISNELNSENKVNDRF